MRNLFFAIFVLFTWRAWAATSFSPTSVNPTSAARGQTMQLSTTVTTSESFSGMIQYRLGNVATNETFFVSDHVVNFVAGQAIVEKQNYLIPALPDGDYRLGVFVHQNSGWIDKGGIREVAKFTMRSGVFRLSSSSATAPSDQTGIKVVSVVVSPSTVSAGSRFKVTAKFYSPIALTNANVIVNYQDAAIRTIAKRVFSGLQFAAGEERTFFMSFLVPSTQTPGSTYISLGAFNSNYSQVLTWQYQAATVNVTRALSEPPPASTPVPTPVATPVPTPVTNGAKLIWSDEFDTRLDLASDANPNGKWRPNDWWQGLGNGGYQDFAGTNWNINPNHPTFAPYNPFEVSSGVLTIKSFRCPAVLADPILQEKKQQGIPGGVPTWCGGHLCNNPKVAKFKYGYYEFRVRFPVQGKGMFPAFWLYSADLGLDPEGKSSAEIDVFETFGKPNSWHFGLPNSQGGEGYGADEDIGGWHVYAIDWQPTYIRLYRDGALRKEVTGTNASWYSAYMDIRLNFAMDAPWFYSFGLNSDANTPNNLSMQFDYVRVYDRKP